MGVRKVSLLAQLPWLSDIASEPATEARKASLSLSVQRFAAVSVPPLATRSDCRSARL
jgi:hypothetical protein